MTSAISENRMQMTIKAPTKDLAEGMRVSEDVKAPNGAMIVPANTALTTRQIAMIASKGILEVPIIREQEQNSRPQPSETNISKAANKNTESSNRGTVMIVDDDPFMREILERVLTGAGFHALDFCQDGQDALNQLEYLEPDIITLDLSMPKLDGASTLKAILRKRPNQKVVIISGNGDTEKVKECMRAGARWYILKPFETKTLTQLLNKIMAN